MVLGAASSIAGCGGSHVASSGNPLPTPPTPSSTSAYIGSQDPGYWSLTVDDTQKAFSYQALTYLAPARSSNFVLTDGLLNLGSFNGVPLGQAVEQAGRSAILRPGDNTAFPVAMVQQSDCFAVSGKLRYLYTALPGQPVQESGNQQSTGYGTFVVSTSSDGKSWNFEDLHNYVLTQLSGGALAAGTENGQDPESFSGTCSTTNGQSTIVADPKSPFPSQQPPTFKFHPAGPFVEDRSSAGITWVGFPMPPTPVSASNVMSGKYRGFVYESTDVTPIHTRPVAFAQKTDGSTGLVGGAYPNDDLTETPSSQYTLALGTEDSALNGVYPNATFTAADIYGSCASVALQTPQVKTSFDANGNLICMAAGVAVVAQVDGKYVVYFTSVDGTPDPTNTTAFFAYVIQFYLYQQ